MLLSVIQPTLVASAAAGWSLLLIKSDKTPPPRQNCTKAATWLLFSGETASTLHQPCVRTMKEEAEETERIFALFFRVDRKRMSFPSQQRDVGVVWRIASHPRVSCRAAQSCLDARQQPSSSSSSSWKVNALTCRPEPAQQILMMRRFLEQKRFWSYRNTPSTTTSNQEGTSLGRVQLLSLHVSCVIFGYLVSSPMVLCLLKARLSLGVNVTQKRNELKDKLRLRPGSRAASIR